MSWMEWIDCFVWLLCKRDLHLRHWDTKQTGLENVPNRHVLENVARECNNDERLLNAESEWIHGQSFSLCITFYIQPCVCFIQPWHLHLCWHFGFGLFTSSQNQWMTKDLKISWGITPRGCGLTFTFEQTHIAKGRSLKKKTDLSLPVCGVSWSEVSFLLFNHFWVNHRAIMKTYLPVQVWLIQLIDFMNFRKKSLLNPSENSAYKNTLWFYIWI